MKLERRYEVLIIDTYDAVKRIEREIADVKRTLQRIEIKVGQG